MSALGQVLYSPPVEGARLGWWQLNVAPHIAIRLKRMFPRARQSHAGTIILAGTDEIARDLEWVLQRYDLDVDQAAAAALAAGAAAFRAREETIARALEGHVPPNTWRDPVRPPRSYQLVADTVLEENGCLLLLDEVGLGKTYTSLLRLRDPSALPALVVTLTALPGQWIDEMAATLPWLLGHILTVSTPYDPTSRRGVHRQPDVLICNYAKLSGWADHLAGRVRTVIFDEVQELRRPDTMKYRAACVIAHQARWAVGLSATPVYNYGGEVHTIAEVIAPGVLGTRAEFTRDWGASRTDSVADEPASGHVVVGDPLALGTYLREIGLVLRRTRVEVGRELPGVIPIEHQMMMDPAELDTLLDADNVDEFAVRLLDAETAKERFVAAGDFDMKLRQATAIAKAPYVAQLVRILLAGGEKVVVFAWHRRVYEIFLEALAAFEPAMFTGSETPRQKEIAKDRFLDDPNCRVLLMSLRSGAGLDGLQRASRIAVFAELDWAPGVHDQCLGRLARDGMGNDPVLGYFPWTSNGSDPEMLDTLDVKSRQSGPLIDPNAPLGVVGTADPNRVKRMAEAYLRRRGLLRPAFAL